MANRHVERMKAQGVLPTLLYYANSELFERADVHILKVYRHTQTDTPDAKDGAFEILSSAQQLTDSDRRLLTEYGGEGLLEEFSDFWRMGHRCAIGRRGGELACVCWMTVETKYIASPQRPCVFVQRCFTLPAHRGHGIYPKTLGFAAAVQRREEPETPIYIESAIANAGSISGIEKAGFTAAGVRVRVGTRDGFLPAGAGHSHFRQLVKHFMLRALPRRLLVVQGPVRGNSVYLTFDDGPHPENTPPLLDMLREHKVPSTFFVVGHYAKQYPQIIERMHREGHAVGHHSFHHAPPADISASELMMEVKKTRDVLDPIIGPQRMFRPPEGAVTAKKLLRLWLGGQTVVLWNVDPKDGDVREPSDLTAWFAGNPLHAGDIVLFHDDVPVALKALPDVIASARSRGLEFRALDQNHLS